MVRTLLVLVLSSGVALAAPGCDAGGVTGDESDGGGGGDDDGGGNNGNGDGGGGGGPDAAPPPAEAPELGDGDHTPGSVDLVVVLEGDELRRPMDLEFDPQSGKLWIVNQDDNSWTVIASPESESRSVGRFFDDSVHFLDRPTSLSFHGSEQVVATCQESTNAGDYFMGPVAWTTDPAKFEGGTVSHYDMLHESSNCMGIAWIDGHVWWAFNGRRGSLDRNNYNGWHPDTPDGLGGHDHTDGEIFRYADGELKRVAGVPSGMEYDPSSRRLYVADTGNGRVVKIDANPREGTPIQSLNEEVPLYRVDGVELEQVIAPGTLGQPSGLDLYKNHLYVADHESGVLSAFTLAGQRVNWLDTGLGGGHVTSLTVSPSGRVYFLDTEANRLYRVDPR